VRGGNSGYCTATDENETGEQNDMEKSRVASFYKVMKKVNLLCATLAGYVLLFVTLSIFVDVFLRYVFGRPSIWITEVSTYLFLYIIYLSTAYTLQKGTHIKVTFLLDPLGPRAQRIINLVTSIFGIVFTVVLLWQSSLMTWSAYKGHWTSPTMLSAPFAYIHGIMVLGSFLLLLTFICTTILEFRGEDPMSERRE
jgi:TRAP-type C4-dicarboxylate transport system permease small subunit